MIPVRDNLLTRDRPWVTYAVTALVILIYLWDRGGGLFGPPVAFADLALRPSQVVSALRVDGDLTDLSKLFTSMFMHANLAHLISNVVFLVALGPNVENALGGPRYALFYLFWGVMASAAQIQVDPASTVPVLGASGAIGGVMGAYFLLFPGNEVRVIIVPLLWRTFVLPAWVLLGVWFLSQILLPQEGVATWAHAGGFLAGMLTVAVLGGRNAILKHQDLVTDPNFDLDDD